LVRSLLKGAAIIYEADKTSRPLNFPAPEKVHEDCPHYFFGPDFKDPC
jgi:hypothetical protein